MDNSSDERAICLTLCSSRHFDCFLFAFSLLLIILLSVFLYVNPYLRIKWILQDGMIEVILLGWRVYTLLVPNTYGQLHPGRVGSICIFTRRMYRSVPQQRYSYLNFVYCLFSSAYLLWMLFSTFPSVHSWLLDLLNLSDWATPGLLCSIVIIRVWGSLEEILKCRNSLPQPSY